MNNKLKVLLSVVAILFAVGCGANESTKTTQVEATDTLKTVELKSSTAEAKYMGLHTGMTLEEVSKYLQLNKITTEKITAEYKKTLADSRKSTRRLSQTLREIDAMNGVKRPPVKKKSPEEEILLKKSLEEEILLYSMKNIGIDNDVLKEHEDFKNKKFAVFFLSFTDDKILWKITFLYYLPGEILHRIALKKALEKHFDGHNISQITREKYILEYYQVVMIDNKVSDAAIEKYSQTYLNKL